MRAEKTALTAAALNYFKINAADDLSTAIYAPTMTNDRLAGFGRHVMRVAQAGDKNITNVRVHRRLLTKGRSEQRLKRSFNAAN